MSRLFEKYHINIWVYGYSPIHGTRSRVLLKVQNRFVPLFSIFWTLSPGFVNNHSFKCWSGIFPTILTYITMLGNCQKSISVYGDFPIQGTKFSFLLKFNEARISELNVCLNVLTNFMSGPHTLTFAVIERKPRI